MVQKVRHRRTRKVFAMKKIEKSRMKSGILSKLREEIAILKLLDRPNICHLFEVSHEPRRDGLVGRSRRQNTIERTRGRGAVKSREREESERDERQKDVKRVSKRRPRERAGAAHCPPLVVLCVSRPPHLSPQSPCPPCDTNSLDVRGREEDLPNP